MTLDELLLAVKATHDQLGVNCGLSAEEAAPGLMLGTALGLSGSDTIQLLAYIDTVLQNDVASMREHNLLPEWIDDEQIKVMWCTLRGVELGLTIATERST